jgi:hypothetical protein
MTLAPRKKKVRMAKVRKASKWTAQQIVDFRAWHEARLDQLGYPAAIRNKMGAARESWMPGEER